MAVIVTKTFTTTCLGELKDAINANVIITTNLEQIVYTGGADTDFYFASALSGPEDTELDSVLAGWSCPPAPPTNDENVDDANGPDSDTVWTSDKITTDFVNVSGDSMTGALAVDATVTSDQLVIKHPSNVQQDVTIDPNGLFGAPGFSISKGATGGGFMSLMPNSETLQWIAASPSAANGANRFFFDVDNQGELYLNVLGGAGKFGAIIATNNAPMYPAEDGNSDLGRSTERWNQVYGVDYYGSTLKLTNGSGNIATVQAPAAVFTNYTLTLPVNDGDSGQVLTTDGNGVLSWTAKTTAAVGIQGQWEFDSATGASNPGAGNFRINNSNPALATALYIADENKPGVDFSVILSAIDVGDVIYFQNEEDAGEGILATVSSVTDNGTWFNFGITVQDSNGASFTDGKEFGFIFALGVADTDTGITELTGDVTAGPGDGAQSATIANDAVSYAKMQNVVGNNVLLGNNAGAGGIVAELTATQVRSILNVGDGADVSSAANITDNSIVRGDGGAKGVQDSDGTGLIDWTIADNGQMIGNGDISGDYVLTVRNLNATSGDGFRVRAGEALGDIAFSIEDSDGSFNIMQLEADQGHVTFGKTYAQTLTDNGIVYGVDIQSTGVAKDFNTQAGQYRIGGVPIPLAKFNMFADQVDFPRGSDWAVNNGAPASADSNNSGFVVRRFDDTTPEAFGFQTGAPENAKEMIIITACRAETAPGSTQTVKLQLHFRSIPDNAPPSSWTTVNLTDVSIPTNENFQYDVTSNTLAGWGLTAGTAYQMQLSRNAGDVGDTLSGDMSMLGLTLEFR